MSDDPTRDAVRAVTRAVVARLGDASPQVMEAVVSEVLAALGPAPSPAGPVTTPRGATLLPVVGNPAPSLDYCATCIEQEKARTRRRAVMTTTGKNAKGIVARVTAQIAELGGDILDISQTLVGDFFTMIIVVDVGSLAVPFERFQEALTAAATDLGCQSMIMHEDVMASLHRV
jgi:ACT domain-containing protein